MKKLSFFFFMVVLGLGVFSCSKSDSEQQATGSGKLEIRLTDAPAEYEAVWIDIQKVMINAESDSTDKASGWKELKTIKKGVYNLLELTNGLDTLLASDELPAGKLSVIRLILGTENSIQINGQKYSLKTPSAQTSGLKILVKANLDPSKPLKILLDFDASRSIVQLGKSNNYLLKPVIRAVVEEQVGAIAGTINPDNAKCAVFAIGADSVGTYPKKGKFMIKGLGAGNYRIVVVSKDFKVKTVEGIKVEAGKTTATGEIKLEK